MTRRAAIAERLWVVHRAAVSDAVSTLDVASGRQPREPAFVGERAVPTNRLEISTENGR